MENLLKSTLCVALLLCLGFTAVKAERPAAVTGNYVIVKTGYVNGGQTITIIYGENNIKEIKIQEGSGTGVNKWNEKETELVKVLNQLDKEGYKVISFVQDYRENERSIGYTYVLFKN